MVFDVTRQLLRGRQSQLILYHEIRDRPVTLLGITVFERRSQVPSGRVGGMIKHRAHWQAELGRGSSPSVPTSPFLPFCLVVFRL